MVCDEITEIANKAKIKINVTDNVVDIKHRFRFGDKSLWGVLFFLIAGIFFIVAIFITSSDITTKILSIIIGLFLLIISILTFARQYTDVLKINDRNITIGFNLKRKTIPITKSLRIRMKAEKVEIRRSGTIGTDIVTITHFLQDINKEIRIFHFQMDYIDLDIAIKLGNEIKNIINRKIEKFNF